jgi:hypothetical protein
MFPSTKTTILLQALLACGLVVAFSTAKADTFAFRLPLQGLKASAAGSSLSPAFSISPSPLNFGPVNVGQSATASLTIKNTGNAEADELQFSASTNFTLGGGCSSPLPAGSQCTESVTFTPTAGQSYSGSLNVSNASVTATTVLSGTGLLAADQISSTTLAFGNQAVGTTSAAQAVQLSNTGNTALGISSVTTTGNFAATQNCGTSLAPAASCAVNVTFTPSTGSALTGNLSIATAVGTESVSLTGTGLLAVGQLSTTSLAFGNQTVGTTSTTQSVQLTNTGNTALGISSVTTTGNFAVTHNCGSSLAQGASCTASVTFSPGTASALTGNLSFTTDVGAKSVSLTGTGVAAAPSYSLTPNPIAFGVVGGVSNSLTVTLRNTGSTAFSVGSLSAALNAGTPPSSPLYLSSDTCSGTTVIVGRSCSFVVNLDNVNVGDYSGTLTVPINGTTQTYPVTLSFYD